LKIRNKDVAVPLISILLFFVINFEKALAAPILENPPIRVRLETALHQVELDGLGFQIRGREKVFQPVAIPQRQHIQIRRELMNGHAVWKVLRSPSQQTEIITDELLAIKAIEIRHQGKLLPNQVFLSSHSALKFDVIGVLPLENYLVGVLASEMPLSWPLETLKAQAIAARSYALVTMKERARQPFHVESSVLDQVFSHIGNEVDESPLIAKAKEAVRATAGYVLLAEKGKLLKAYYHSDCGGKTANGPNVWGMGPQTGSAIDASCPNSPKARWTLQISESTLVEKLKVFLRKPGLGSLLSLQLIRPSATDRVDKVELVWEGGQKTLIRAHEFRSSLGFDQFRSTLFDFQKNQNNYTFTGQGFGHGVGLCQWGARELGKQGQTFQQILFHYYSKAELVSGPLLAELLAEKKAERKSDLNSQLKSQLKIELEPEVQTR
jgi:stage II sporulation protein D